MATPYSVSGFRLLRANNNIWKVGSSYYLSTTPEAATTHASVWKSSDTTSNNWTRQDSTNEPVGTLGNNYYSILQGSVILTLRDGTTSDLLTLGIFDTTSDTWTLTDATNVTSNGYRGPSYGAGIRGDGDILVASNGANESIMGTGYARAMVHRRESGSWTLNIRTDNLGKVAEDLVTQNAIMADTTNSRFHVVYLNFTNSTLHLSTYLSNNTWGQQDASIDSTVPGTSELTWQAVSFTDGANRKVRAAYADSGSPNFISIAGWNDADAPSISTVATHINDNNTASSLGLVVDGTTQYYIYGISASSTQLYYSKTGAGDDTWATDTACLSDASTYGGAIRGMGIFDSKLAYIINHSTGNTEYYDEISLASGATYTLTAAAGSFAETGVASAFKASRKLTAAAGSYSITGVAAALTYQRVLTASAGSFSLSGVASAFKASRVLTAAQGSYALTGVAANTAAARNLVASAGTYDLTGVAAALSRHYTVAVNQVSYALTGSASGLSAARKLTAGSATYTIGGQNALLTRGYTLTASLGTYALAGQASGLIASRKLTAGSATYTLTGQASGLSAGRKLAAAAGSYTLTGNAAPVTVARILAAAAGSYSLSGVDAILTYTPVGGPTYTLIAANGAFTLTGVASGLSAGRKLVAGQGAYNLTGNASGLSAGRKLTAGQGTYTITGQAAAVTAARKLTAGQGTYNITGQAAPLVAGRKLIAAQGTYNITGQASGLVVGRTLIAGAGTYTLSGNAAGVAAARKLVADAGSYALTGAAATLTYGQASAQETPNTGGWIDPHIARRILREARALQKAQEDQAKDRRAEIERRRQSLHTTLERTYAELTGETLPNEPEMIAEIIEAPKLPTPNNVAADAIAVYLAVMSIGDALAMSAALDALDRALLAIRIAMQEADDEEVLLLAAY